MPLARFERTTPGLGIRCSIHLSYRGSDGRLPLSPGRRKARGPVDEPSRGGEHAVEHRLGEPSRERVLLARMIRPQEHEPVRQDVPRAVGEARKRPRQRAPCGAICGEKSDVSNVAKRDDHAQPPEELQLLDQIRPAVLDLARRGAVVGRRAARHGGDVGLVQLEPVATMLRRGLVREAGAVKRPEEPSAALVAGEDAPGPVPAMRRGREADDEEPRLGIAEPRDRTPPVLLVAEPRHLDGRRSFPVRDEPRAAPADGHARSERAESGHSLQSTPAVRNIRCVSRTLPNMTLPSPAGSTRSTWTPHADGAGGSVAGWYPLGYWNA